MLNYMQGLAKPWEYGLLPLNLEKCCFPFFRTALTFSKTHLESLNDTQLPESIKGTKP